MQRECTFYSVILKIIIVLLKLGVGGTRRRHANSSASTTHRPRRVWTQLGDQKKKQSKLSLNCAEILCV